MRYLISKTILKCLERKENIWKAFTKMCKICQHCAHTMSSGWLTSSRWMANTCIQFIHLQPKHWWLSVHVTIKYFLPLYVAALADIMQACRGGRPSSLTGLWVSKTVISKAHLWKFSLTSKKSLGFHCFLHHSLYAKDPGGQSGRSQVSPVSSHDWMRVCFLLSRESASVCLPLLPVCLVFVSSAVKSLCLPLSAFHVAALVLAQVVVT